MMRKVALSVVGLVGLLIVDTGLPLAKMYVASSLFAAFLMYMFRKPPLIDVLAIMLLGPLATGLHTWFWFNEWFRPRVFMILGGYGVAAVLILTARLIWSEREQGKKSAEILGPVIALTAVLFASTWLNGSGKLWPQTLDLYAFSFDASMGANASFWMGKMFTNHPWFGVFGTSAYHFILIAMILAQIAYEKRRLPQISRTFVLEACFVAAVLGFSFYQLYPACGPLYAFPNDFPFGAIPAHDVVRLALAPISLETHIPRNAMPSLHMTWALLIWWNLRSCGRVLHALGFIFAMLTMIGTLGTGEHYLIDLVVAFPFTVMIQGISRRELAWSARRKWVGVVAGLTTTLVWIVLLRVGIRWFWISPVISWTAVALTIGGSLYLSLPLTRFEKLGESDKVVGMSKLVASAG